MAISDESIKRIVREEVTRQMAEMAHQTFAPIYEKLNLVDKRVRSFYSNGSGGPPGALEIWRKQDEDARKEDRQDFAELKETVIMLATESAKATDFIKEHKRDKEDAKKRQRGRVRFWKWLIGIAAPIIIALFGFVYHNVSPVVSYMWEEYVKAHPALQMKLEHHSRADRQEFYSRTFPENAKE